MIGNGSRFLALALGLLVLSGCFASRPPPPRPVVRQIPATQIAVVDPGVTILVGGAPTAARRPDLEARLRAGMERMVRRRGPALAPAGTDDAERAGRIQKALIASPMLVHREYVGVANPSPRGRVVAADLEPLAAERGADLVLLARFVGNDTDVAQRMVDSAMSFVGGAALGVVSLSPGKVVRAAIAAPNASPGSNLRVALVQPFTGEILWANWVVTKKAPSPEAIDDLVRKAFADFPIGAASQAP